jgi:hypothetical protein
MTETQRTLFWRRLDTPGSEYFALRRVAGSWLLMGTVVVALDGAPLAVSYRVACDARWRTRDVHLTATSHDDVRQLHLTVTADGQWWNGRSELTELRGFQDVDLGVTPSTNTLPIRRMKLPVGESAEITAAWVRFPELTIVPLPQRYTRRSDFRYRYESFPHDFAADLIVDNWGLVLEYSGGWVCEARSGEAPRR